MTPGRSGGHGRNARNTGTNTRDGSETVNAELDRLVEAFLGHLETGAAPPELDGVDSAVRAEAEELFGLIEAAWSTEVDLPPIEEDPVAIRLGLVDPAPIPDSDPEDRDPPRVVIVGAKVKALRQRSRLDARQLTDTANAMGAMLTLAQWVRLERLPLCELSARDATALADALKCPVGDLSADPDHLDWRVAFSYSDDFNIMVDRWCYEHHRDPANVAGQVRRRILAGQHRKSGEGDLADWLDMLRAVLESLG